MSIKITIGRNDDNTLKVPEEFGKVSGYHGEITMNDLGELIFTDYSSNGTIINGQKIHKSSVSIYRGQEILLAGYCTVNWETLNNLLPNPQQDGRATELLEQPQLEGRSTVLLKPSDDGGRKTVLKHTPSHLTPDIKNTETPVQEKVEYPNSYGRNTRKDSAGAISKAIRKWNWGAFFLSFIWGFFHKIYWPLIVPVANLFVFLLPLIIDADIEVFGLVITWVVHLTVIVVAVYLGINGSEQAWKLDVYKDLADFNQKEKRWATAGFIFFSIQLISIAVATVLLILDM